MSEVNVVRDVGLALATDLLQGAHGAAEEMGIAVAAAVVDRGGRLVSAGRMDGAPFGVMDLAIDKAFAASALGASTDAWSSSTQPGGDDWGMHTSLGGRVIVYPGGVPIVADGTVIGSVGVSGGEGAQDRACALAALEGAGLSS